MQVIQTRTNTDEICFYTIHCYSIIPKKVHYMIRIVTDSYTPSISYPTSMVQSPRNAAGRAWPELRTLRERQRTLRQPWHGVKAAQSNRFSDDNSEYQKTPMGFPRTDLGTVSVGHVPTKLVQRTVVPISDKSEKCRDFVKASRLSERPLHSEWRGLGFYRHHHRVNGFEPRMRFRNCAELWKACWICFVGCCYTLTKRIVALCNVRERLVFLNLNSLTELFRMSTNI